MDLLSLAFGPLPCGERSPPPRISWLRSQSRWDVWVSWPRLNLLLLPDQLSHARPHSSHLSLRPSFLNQTVGSAGRWRSGGWDAWYCLALLRGAHRCSGAHGRHSPRTCFTILDLVIVPNVHISHEETESCGGQITCPGHYLVVE